MFEVLALSLESSDCLKGILDIGHGLVQQATAM